MLCEFRFGLRSARMSHARPSSQRPELPSCSANRDPSWTCAASDIRATCTGQNKISGLRLGNFTLALLKNFLPRVSGRSRFARHGFARTAHLGRPDTLVRNLVVAPSHRQRPDLVAAQVEPITEPSAMHLKIFVEHRDELRGSMEFVVAFDMANRVYLKKSFPGAGYSCWH